MNSREWKSLPDAKKETIQRFLAQRPVALGALAKELGLSVMSSTLHIGLSGEIRPDETAPSGFRIRINRHENKARQRFTLAHEIAHFLLHSDDIGDGVVDDLLYRSGLSDRREAEANRLAADLVMPWELINQRVKEFDNLTSEDTIAKLANEFGVSVTAMKIRLGLV